MKLLSPPVATRSKKPDSMAAEVAEKAFKQQEEAGTRPVTAYVESAVLLDAMGGILAAQVSVNTPHLLGVIVEACQDNGSTPLKAAAFSTFGPVVFCDGGPDVMRILHVQAAHVYARHPGLAPRVAALCLHLPFQPQYTCDPYEIALSTGDRGNISRDALATALYAGEPTPYPPATTANEYNALPPQLQSLWLQAESCRQLAIATGQVFGVPFGG